ncbi:hypothetical protein COCOBI_18-0710 [Coccomyxa sp. Obi]|nr:hypothetical protein COCOBI_18-0710 [Coccomyxa sp. Obi]
MAIRSRSEFSTWNAIILLATLSSAAARQLHQAPGVPVSSHRHHPRRTDAHGANLCSRDAVFKIEDHDVGREQRGWMGAEDFLAVAKSMNETAQPFVRVYVDGVPCAVQGCCSASMLIRPGFDSDSDVLSHDLSWYTGFLARLPWRPQTILEGGANMGVATLALAHMYPMAQIVVVEPEPGNCDLLELNTKTYPNVHVECSGLWDKDASLGMVKPSDGRNWGWMTEEVEEGTPGSLHAVSVQSLLKKYNLASFDYIKLDIEGSEWQLFRQDESLEWLEGVKLMSLEVHHGMNTLPGDEDHMVTMLKSRGYDMSRHGEYDVWASQDLHPFLRHQQAAPQPI